MLLNRFMICHSTGHRKRTDEIRPFLAATIIAAPDCGAGMIFANIQNGGRENKKPGS
jgi:hypothetical protein